jgi:hypothetical protein
VSLPGRRQAGHGAARIHRAAVGTLNRERHRAVEFRSRSRIERGAIAGVRTNGNTPEAFVGDAGAAAGRGLGDIQAKTDRNRLVQRRAPVERDRGGPVLLNHRPAHGRLCVVQEGAVVNQLGVQPPVVRMINLLGHQAVEERADLARRRGRIDCDRRSRRRACPQRNRGVGDDAEQQEKQDTESFPHIAFEGGRDSRDRGAGVAA